MGPGDVTAEELDGKHVERINADGTVVHIKIDRDDSVAPGWRYTMHYGLQADADAPLLRYDNYEQPTQHDRHTPDGVERIEFPGIVELYEQFVDEYTRLRTHQRDRDE
jgi:hypothetical protein